MDELAHTVAKLQAAEDIRHLKARYARVCDTGYTASEMAPLFTKDAIWDGGRFGRYEGFDAIYAFFDGVSADIVWALHYMIAPVIEVHDDLVSASGTWYLWQPCTVVTPEGPKAVWLSGGYADRYRKEDGAWRFCEVVLDVQTIAPYEDGWVRRPFWDE